MNLNLKAGLATMFGYNAADDVGRRQPPQTRVKHESQVATARKHAKLRATAQEQVRNLSIVAWMVRKHLDYVSKFHFSFRTGKPDLDTVVNRMFRWHGAPGNLDFGGRFGRDELFRLFELEKVVCGDAGLIKVTKELKLQALESDLIAQGSQKPGGPPLPKDKDGKPIVNDSGLVVDKYGRVSGYSICNRGDSGNSYEFDHLEPVDNVIFDAYWTRFSSQFRGVSPLSTAINTMQDIYEGMEFNLIKAKMHALFGVAVMREAHGTGELGGAGGATAETEDAEAQDDDSDLDLDPRQVNFLDLNKDDKVQILESSTPSSEFVEGSYLFIQIGMMALDIPITCFDSRRSSFSARIADLNEYEVSSDSKRTKNRYVRKAYSDWFLKSVWDNSASAWPLRTVAERNGVKLRDVQESVEWIPSGSPWLDKYKQVQGDQLGIDIGLDNAIDAARRRGADVFDNIDKQAQVLEYARMKGVPIVSGAGKSNSEPEEEEDPAEPTSKARKETDGD